MYSPSNSFIDYSNPLQNQQITYYNESKYIINNPVIEPDLNYYYIALQILQVILLGVTPVEWFFFVLTLTLPRNRTCSQLEYMMQYKTLVNMLRVLEDAAKETLRAVVGFFLLVVLSPIMAPIVLVFFTISEVVKLIYFYRYGKSATKAAGQDAIWGNETVESRPIIVVGITMRGSPDPEKIRDVFSENILSIKDKKGRQKHKKFCQLVSTELGYYVWKDTKHFNIKNHIRMWKDPITEGSKEPVDEDCTGAEDLIKRYLEEYGSDPLPEDKPQWEIVVLDSKCIPDGKYAIIMRLHHSIGDGVSLVRLILGAIADKPLVLPSVGVPKTHPALRLLMFFWALCLLPVEMIKTYTNRDVNPFHGTRLNGRKKFHMLKGVKLQTLKAIKTAYGATINDVLMSCLSASLTRTFSKRWQFYTPHVTAIIPISYHDLTKDVNLVNSFLLAFLKLPTPLPSDVITPKQRLKMVKKGCDHMKRDPGMMALYYATQFMCVIFPARMIDYLFSLRGVTMGASNVPGPQELMKCWGDTIDGVGFWVPDRSPTGAGVGMISYGGMVRVSVMLDGGLIGDRREMEQIEEEFHAEVRNLYNAIGGSEGRIKME